MRSAKWTSPWRSATSGQTVEVTGQATVLETEVGHISSQMNQATLAQLPVPNNSVFNLMVLQPGVTGQHHGGGQPLRPEHGQRELCRRKNRLQFLQYGQHVGELDIARWRSRGLS